MKTLVLGTNSEVLSWLFWFSQWNNNQAISWKWEGKRKCWKFMKRRRYELFVWEKSSQAFSVKDQIVNILGFQSPIISVTTTQLCYLLGENSHWYSIKEWILLCFDIILIIINRKQVKLPPGLKYGPHLDDWTKELRAFQQALRVLLNI